MSNSLEYQGYHGIVEFSAEDNLFHGRIFGINDLVTFEGGSVKQLRKNFRDAVDDYLSTCGALGKEPERPYKGNFNVRISPDTHRKAAFKAQALRISLNELVERAITKEVGEASAMEPPLKGLSASNTKRGKRDQRKPLSSGKRKKRD